MSQVDINAWAILALLGFQVLSYLLLVHRLRRIERRQVADVPAPPVCNLPVWKRDSLFTETDTYQGRCGLPPEHPPADCRVDEP